MSYLSTLIPDCPNIQASLLSVFGNCFGAGRFRDELPFLTFLASSANSGRLSQQISPGNGKVRTIELIYDQRLSLDGIQRNVDNPKCEAEGKKGQCVVTCTIDTSENLNIGCKIDAQDLERNCQANGEYIQEQILDLVDALDRQISKDIAAKAVSFVGAWATDVTNQDCTAVTGTNLQVSAGDKINPSGLTYQAIETAAMLTEYCPDKALFGGIDLWNYYQTIQSGCCASNGIDLSEQFSRFGLASLYDRDIVEAYGANNFALLTQPGALQLITYTRAGWTNGIPGEFHGQSYYSTTIVSPKTGIPMDLTVKEDCGSIHINLTATVDLKAMPADLYAPGDRLEGVNFVNTVEFV